MAGFTLVMGGHGSGKSAFAEDMFSGFDGPKYYIATMVAADEEGRQRIARHRKAREGKGFITLEIPEEIETAGIEPGAGVLLECATNLLANEMFGAGDDDKRDAPDYEAGCGAARRCADRIEALSRRAGFLVVVTTDTAGWERELSPEGEECGLSVESEECRLSVESEEFGQVNEETAGYIRAHRLMNELLTAKADEVYISGQDNDSGAFKRRGKDHDHLPDPGAIEKERP